jgi:hypothetical protein
MRGWAAMVSAAAPGARPRRVQEMLPDRHRRRRRRRDDGIGRQGAQAAREISVARPEPAHDAWPIGEMASQRRVRRERRIAEERFEAERLDSDSAIRHAERDEERADARLGGDGERGGARPQRAQRRDREQDVAECARMDRQHASQARDLSDGAGRARRRGGGRC